MKLKKKVLFHILSMADREDVISVSKRISDNYSVISVRPAQKTLAMLKVREPVSASLFYLGEMLCSECMVEINGVKGFAVLAGDDFDKVTAAAVIDSALNAGLPEKDEIEKEIFLLEKKQRDSRKNMNAAIMKSKVNFSVMGE